MDRRRRRARALGLALALAAMALGLFWLVWILVGTVSLGLGGLAFSVFTESTPPPQADVGGLANAIVGSLIMVSLATLLGTPIGVMAGIYLAEYGKNRWLGAITPLGGVAWLVGWACLAWGVWRGGGGAQ